MCRGEQPIDVRWITWPYKLPAPLARLRGSDWDIPHFQVPAHCAAIAGGDAGQLNEAFLKEANHPCNFLNQTYGLPRKLSHLIREQSRMELPLP